MRRPGHARRRAGRSATISRIGDRLVADVRAAEIEALEPGTGRASPTCSLGRERAESTCWSRSRTRRAPSRSATMIAASPWRERIVVGGFHGPALAAVKARAPAMRTSLHDGQRGRRRRPGALAAAYRADGVHCAGKRARRGRTGCSIATRSTRLRKAGLAVTLWHEEREDELRALVALRARRDLHQHARRAAANRRRASATAAAASDLRTHGMPASRRRVDACEHDRAPTWRRTHELETCNCRNRSPARCSSPRATPALAEDVVIKVWSRADRSGPLRAGNIVAAGDTLNKMLAAAGSDKRVKIELNETNAKGYDDDALDLLKAFAVDKGPDIFVLAHEWTGAFAEAGYAQNLEDHIAKNPELYGDIIAPLWQAVTLQGRALWRAAGFRSAHVLPQQRQAAQDRQDRQGDRRAAGQGRRRRVHRIRPVRPRRPGGAEGRRRSTASCTGRTRVPTSRC